MKSRRELLLLTAGAAGLAGCSGGERGSTPTETATTPTSTNTPTETETATQEPTETATDEPENQEWKNEVRSGVPLNGLGAYTDQMLGAKEGPVREATTEKVKAILEGQTTPEDERNSLVEALTEENYETLFSEYHRQKGKQGDTENQVVLNRNWSFTSDSEPIFEFYKVQNGNLQSQPVILDPDPETYNRQVNKPGTGEPEYLADLRDSSDGAQRVPEDHDAMEALIKSYARLCTLGI